MANVVNFYIDDSGTRHPSRNPEKRQPMAMIGFLWAVNWSMMMKKVLLDSYMNFFAKSGKLRARFTHRKSGHKMTIFSGLDHLVRKS